MPPVKKASPPTPRKAKAYVESKDAALQLAESVATEQEGKSAKKVEKQHHQAQLAAKKPDGRPHKRSGSKARLKQVKASLMMQAAKAKSEKAKSRRQGKASKLQSQAAIVHEPAGSSKAKPGGGKKHVSFG
ncbi:hypothetical protein B0H21DRAFT_39263 [Amylocystis lapponica]|nr:hypothetical protein B0H21DRAFT_39263 [Amylocystis lapponica]